MTRDLRESEARVRAVLDNTLDAIITIDEQGLMESFNLAAERLFGRRTEEVLGKNIKLLMPEPYAGEHDGYLSAYRDTGRRKIIGIGREVVGMRADGSCFPMELAVTEVVVNDRRRFIGLVRDISERKQSERQLRELNRRFDLAVESAGIGVWDWDIATNAMIWDDRMISLYGISREGFVGTSDAFANAVHPDDRERTIEELRVALADDETFDTEFRIRVGDSVRYIKANAVVLRDELGQAQRMIGINYDISERKKSERLKSEFVSTVSHELRTPLTSIRGSLGLIEGGVAGELPAAAKSLIAIAASNCERLVGLINDILDTEKIASGKLTFNLETQALMPLVQQAVEANQGFAAQHEVQLEFVSGVPMRTSTSTPIDCCKCLPTCFRTQPSFRRRARRSRCRCCVAAIDCVSRLSITARESPRSFAREFSRNLRKPTGRQRVKRAARALACRSRARWSNAWVARSGLPVRRAREVASGSNCPKVQRKPILKMSRSPQGKQMPVKRRGYWFLRTMPMSGSCCRYC